VNPGSVGQPRDDDPRPSYLIMDTRNGSLVFHRFDYPREQLKKDLTAKIDDTTYLERLFKLFRL
jgi:protein phosphatase